MPQPRLSRPVKAPSFWLILVAIPGVYYGVGALVFHPAQTLLALGVGLALVLVLRGRVKMPTLPPSVRRHLPFAIVVAVAVLFIVAMLLAPTAADQYDECFASETPPSNPKVCQDILDVLFDQ